ncbi:MAG: hypothetical protein V4557_16245 [Bacteroidota bacterium]
MSYVIPPGSHRIPLEQAKTMVLRYNEQKEEILNPDLQAQNILPVSETFRKDAILAYLAKDFVYAIRIYYGMTEDKQVHAIIIGVDKDGNDILPKSPQQGTEHGHPHPPVGDGEEGEIFEDALRCPSTCPPPGWPKLNSIP